MVSGGSDSAARTSAGLTPIRRRIWRARRPSARRRNCASHAPGRPIRPPRSRRSTSGGARPRCPAAQRGARRPSSRRRRRTGIRRRRDPRRPPESNRPMTPAARNSRRTWPNTIEATTLPPRELMNTTRRSALSSAPDLRKSTNACGVSVSITPSATITCGTARAAAARLQRLDAKRHRAGIRRRRGGAEERRKGEDRADRRDARQPSPAGGR